MSNKTLIITIAVIAVVAIGAVLAYRSRNSNSSNLLQYQSQNNTPASPAQDQNTANQQPSASSTPPQASSTNPTTMNDQACKRDFDQNKLNTAKVSIANRQVEMDVKGFGKIQLVFYDKDAPKTVENFLRLVNAGYYDCLTFHRIAKGFVIQGGDPTGTGSGGQSAFGAPFADELNADTASYKAGYVKGVLAMANSGPNTNGSQFFIMLDDVQLNHAYTIFGKVSAGLDVVDKIGNVDITPNLNMNPAGTDGTPVKPVVMTSVKIVK